MYYSHSFRSVLWLSICRFMFSLQAQNPCQDFPDATVPAGAVQGQLQWEMTRRFVVYLIVQLGVGLEHRWRVPGPLLALSSSTPKLQLEARSLLLLGATWLVLSLSFFITRILLGGCVACRCVVRSCLHKTFFNRLCNAKTDTDVQNLS